MKKIILSALALVALASCTKEQEAEVIPSNGEVRISSSIATRTNGNNWEANDAIGVFMASDREYYSSETAKNRKHTTDGTGNFTSESPLYFPTQGNANFMAYYPYTDAINLDTMVIPVDVSDQTDQGAIDLMFAEATDVANSSAAVNMTFEHQLARIKLNIKSSGSVKASDLEGLVVTLSGTPTTAEFDIMTRVQEYFPFYKLQNIADITMLTSANGTAAEAIIIPQTAVENVSLTLETKDSEGATISTYSTPISTKSFTIGNEYTYNVTLCGNEEVTISSPTIDTWGPGNYGEDLEALLPEPASYVQFKRKESNTANMTKVDDTKAIENILAKFRRCLMTSDDSGNATICYLDNNNSELYYDGTAAALDGSEGEVMVYFPEFWYKYENVDDDYFRYHFSESEQDGYIHVEASLVGAYKAYNEDNMVYSRSGVKPTNYVSQANFKSYAAARGTGYQIIDYHHHCTIAMMLYAKYLDRDTQAILGAGGANNSTTTGSTNSLGNVDSVNESSAWVNGLGLEGVFGGIAEWIEGVEVNYYNWYITTPTGHRTVRASSSDGYITALALEQAGTDNSYFDMVPTTASDDSASTYYADYYSCYFSGRVVYRGYNNTDADGGVAYANAYFKSSVMSTGIGSRLAFRGTINVATSVADYKEMFETSTPKVYAVGDLYPDAENPVGVVFWVGNPANPAANDSGLTYLGDTTLATDHPNCVNGLVVALNDTDGGKTDWQNPYTGVESWRENSTISDVTFCLSTNDSKNGETLNRIGGYNNSKVISAFNIANADNKVLPYEAIEAYASANPAPATSSGWYLPSAKELALLCGTGEPNNNIYDDDFGTDNITAINGILDGIEGASQMQGNYYWSSTEFDNSDAWKIALYGSTILNSKINSNNVRAVLAF